MEGFEGFIVEVFIVSADDSVELEWLDSFCGLVVVGCVLFEEFDVELPAAGSVVLAALLVVFCGLGVAGVVTFEALAVVFWVSPPPGFVLLLAFVVEF